MVFNKLFRINQPGKRDSQSLILRFFALLALHLFLYTCIRFCFYFWNFKQLKSISFIDLLYAFITGIRFDLAAVGPFCVLATLLALWIRSHWKYLFILPLLIFQNFLMNISVVDSELANYMGRRFTVNSLYVLGEGGANSVLAYTPLVVFCVFMVAIYFYCSIVILNYRQKTSFLKKVSLTCLLLILAVIFGRGGLQEKPISFINSKVLNHPSAHQLVLNSVFTFVKSIGRDHIEKVKYFEEDEMLGYLNLNPKLYTKVTVEPQKMNVMIIMMESLSSEYINEKYTPFFDVLSKKGVLFNPAYANGRRSVEGIAAVLSGIPSLMEESFINSEFANEFVGLGTLLKTQGYHTSFFHGAQNGSMRFDAFTHAAGFDHYYGKDQFNDNSQDDGAWGIYDEPFLKWTCGQISNFPDRFATVIFTLTAHVPYPLPSDFKRKIEASDLKNEQQIIKSIYYADGALRDFFTCAQSKPWFKNTLFVLLGDHTGPSLKTDADFKSKFEIPILFYTEDPAKLKGLNPNQLAQQIDVLPTITDFVGIPLLEKNHLARSLFEPGKKTIALFSDQKYELVGDTEKSENHLKAIRQYFSQGLYDNRLYFPRVPTK